jgi:hypothetical protein
MEGAAARMDGRRGGVQEERRAGDGGRCVDGRLRAHLCVPICTILRLLLPLTASVALMCCWQRTAVARDLARAGSRLLRRASISVIPPLEAIGDRCIQYPLGGLRGFLGGWSQFHRLINQCHLHRYQHTEQAIYAPAPSRHRARTLLSGLQQCPGTATSSGTCRATRQLQTALAHSWQRPPPPPPQQLVALPRWRPGHSPRGRGSSNGRSAHGRRQIRRRPRPALPGRPCCARRQACSDSPPGAPATRQAPAGSCGPACSPSPPAGG